MTPRTADRHLSGGAGEGRNPGTYPVHLANAVADIWLPAATIADLTGVTPKAVRKSCARGGTYRDGRYVFRWAKGKNGGEQYEIALASLPRSAQERYLDERLHDRGRVVGTPLPQADELPASVPAIPCAVSPTRKSKGRYQQSTVPFPQDAYEVLWQAYAGKSAGDKERAERRLAALDAYVLMTAAYSSKEEAAAAVARTHHVGRTTLWRLEQVVRGHDKTHWLPLLATTYQGREPSAEITSEAWDFICDRWLTTSRQPVMAVYAQAKTEAVRRGWILPSVKTVTRMLNALPERIKVAGRQGYKALERMSPAQNRIYSTLRVHELWESDGRRADVFCRWPDGHVGRPFVVIWRDVRTRCVLGVRGFKNANMGVVRLALRNAIERTGAIPEEGLLDNGMEYAAKGMTGGQKTRYRFKCNEDDPLGVLTLLGTNIHWAGPGRGQSKPIEALWKWIADHADKRAEFVGGYCGNSPVTRPEDFNPGKAIPIEHYGAVLAQVVEEFNQRIHRGNGMSGKSPLELYSELIQIAEPRKPTPMQLKLCMLEAANIALDKEDGRFVIDGISYWHESLVDLPRYKKYHAYYDPEYPTQPALILDRDRVICEAAPLEGTPFLSRESGKQRAQARSRFVKETRGKLKVLRKKGQAATSDSPQRTAPVLLSAFPQPRQWAGPDKDAPCLPDATPQPRVEPKSGQDDTIFPVAERRPQRTDLPGERRLDQNWVNEILTQEALKRVPIPKAG